MKKTSFIIILLAFVAFTSQAQTKVDQTKVQEKVVVEKIVGPEIQFNYTSYDYGTIIKGEHDGGCEFVFTNIGTEPLILSNAQASCGCTTPTWTREPVLPGKTGIIKVKYNMGIGVFNKNITVTSNAKTDRVVLKISGKVEEKPSEIVPEKPKNQLPRRP